MLARISIMLDEKDALALSILARREYRDLRQQAAILIHDELVRQGLLPKTPIEANSSNETLRLTDHE